MIKIMIMLIYQSYKYQTSAIRIIFTEYPILSSYHTHRSELLLSYISCVNIQPSQASVLSDESSPCYPGCRTRGSSTCRWTRSISTPAINDCLFFISSFLYLVFYVFVLVWLYNLVMKLKLDLSFPYWSSLTKYMMVSFWQAHLLNAYTLRVWPMTSTSQLIITQFKTPLC